MPTTRAGIVMPYSVGQPRSEKGQFAGESPRSSVAERRPSKPELPEIGACWMSVEHVGASDRIAACLWIEGRWNLWVLIRADSVESAGQVAGGS